MPIPSHVPPRRLLSRKESRLHPILRFAIMFLSSGLYTFAALILFQDKDGGFSTLGILATVGGYLLLTIMLWKTGITTPIPRSAKLPPSAKRD